LVHAFSVVHEEQVGWGLTLFAWQVRQRKVVAQQQFVYEHHEGLGYQQLLVGLQHHANLALGDLHHRLEDLVLRGSAVRGEQYDDPCEHHQHSLSVDQYRISGLQFAVLHPNRMIFQSDQLSVHRNEFPSGIASHHDGSFPG
jgi:hypothetical protein